MNKAPEIDSGSAADIAGQVRELLKIYTPEWREARDPLTGDPKGVGTALIETFARFCEIVLHRLNRVPEKNYLAFLDLLGVSQLPPQPARVPLTFSLTPGSAVDGVVPPGTQVASPAGAGGKEAVIFETEEELVVTAAALASLQVRDPTWDSYADLSHTLGSDFPDGVPMFQGTRWINHVLYIGHAQLFAHARIRRLALDVTLATQAVLEDPRTLAWERWDGEKWAELVPSVDETQQLRGSGRVAFEHATAIPLGSFEAHQGQNRWIRCRLTTPITPTGLVVQGMVRASQLPVVSGLTLEVLIEERGLQAEAAFTGRVPVDVTKDFYPFGEKPKLGETLYLASDVAFSEQDATVTLHVELTNPASGEPAPTIPRTTTDGNPVLRWENWNGRSWEELGTSTLQGPQAPAGALFDDTTNALTASGKITFRLRERPQPAVVNGVRHCWIRVRILSGHYGEEARYVPDQEAPGGLKLMAATFGPPSIRSIGMDFDLLRTGVAPEGLWTRNDFTGERPPGLPFQPFRATADRVPTLYLGFELPAGRTAFPNRTLSILWQLFESRYGERTAPVWPARVRRGGQPGEEAAMTFVITNHLPRRQDFQLAVFGTRWNSAVTPATVSLDPLESRDVVVTLDIPADASYGSGDAGSLRVIWGPDGTQEQRATFVTVVGAGAPTREHVKHSWEYWNGAWAPLSVRDRSAGFTTSGLMQFLVPADAKPREEFGRTRFWIRVRWESGEYDRLPRLCRPLLNTVTAAQVVSIRDEVLGSSNGSERQRFRANRRPVLSGQRLEVREPDQPSPEDLDRIVTEEGPDAVREIGVTGERARDRWVRWHEVSDFYGSGPRDRHYVIDHLTGEVRFGDGITGMIPPARNGNILLASYRTGGGTAGNRPAESVTQLKTTVPYVAKVTNLQPAAGGAEAETMADLLGRAPREMRHRGRAVTREDYEDLALAASPRVARARCVPLHDLAADPLGTRVEPGTVSVLVVPRSDVPKPVPSLELLEGVRQFLVRNGPPNARAVTVGPDYVRVSVTVEVGLASLEGAGLVESRLVDALERFLHPLRGGFEGAGWDYGRQPHKSDLYALIEGVPGVDHVRRLLVSAVPDREGALETDRFLVYSGVHQVSVRFEES